MKTSANQIALRYVSALFSVTGDAQVRAAVEQDFARLGGALATNEDLAELIRTPLLTREQQAQAMDALLAAMDADTATRKFVALLARQKRLTLLPEIIDLYSKWASDSRGEMQAELISATKVSAGDANAVADKLSKVYGKKIALKTSENPEILGGAIVKIGSLQLDSSLLGKMRRLKNVLQTA